MRVKKEFSYVNEDTFGELLRELREPSNLGLVANGTIRRLEFHFHTGTYRERKGVGD